MEVAGANRRWPLQFRCRGSRRESAVAQLFSLGGYLCRRAGELAVGLVYLISSARDDRS